ncbi:MAG: DUF1566 domain-containing protein [Nitrospira sp. LK70]|nr:DUF1566 domain-containing protein [Nitrospira sp. LK70]
MHLKVESSMRLPPVTRSRAIVVTLVVIGAFCLLAYTQIKSHTQGKEEVIATIIKNWQQAHPAAQRFVILADFNNEAVLDKDTSLIWELSPMTTSVTWNEARATCLTRATGGQRGWRLPAPAEMRSLVGPAVDSPIPNIPPGHPFMNIQPTSYWTVVPEANQPSYARYVDAFLGNVLSLTKLYTYPVWCVRGPIKQDD